MRVEEIESCLKDNVPCMFLTGKTVKEMLPYASPVYTEEGMQVEDAELYCLTNYGIWLVE
jgi:hypothetical protein